jgi:hypothetical protein
MLYFIYEGNHRPESNSGAECLGVKEVRLPEAKLATSQDSYSSDWEKFQGRKT